LDPSTATPVAFTFPGQGAQYVGMGKANAARFPAARAVFDEADSVLGFRLSTLCFEGPQAELDRTETSQPAIFTASVASLAAWRAHAGDAVPAASVAAGLSLGEYTALYYAGALSFADGLRLVRERGLAMQAACDAIKSGMTSIIGLARDQLEKIRDEASAAGVLCLANINSPEQIALSGSMPALERAGELARAAGAKRVIPLAVAGAFHSSLMQPARERLERALASVRVAAPRIPVVSNVSAQPTTDPAAIKDALARQLTGAVEWVGCVERMRAMGVQAFYEVGPGKVLTGLLKRIDRAAEGKSIDEVGA